MNRLRPTTTNGPFQVESFTGRKKVTLAPGHSLMDWIKLGRENGDLSGVGPSKLQVSAGELAVHNTQKDIWMGIRGKVYNLTPYMEYHPGGIDELMRAAGKDGTDLFDEIHNWVNVESMLEKCLVGTLMAGSTRGQVKNVRSRSVGSIVNIKPTIPQPTYDWYQKDSSLTIVIYTKWTDMTSDLVLVDVSTNALQIVATIKDFSYFVHIKPSQPLLPDCAVTVAENGKAEVILNKTSPGKWETLGEPLTNHDSYLRTKGLDCKYRTWTVLNNTVVSHDTKLLSFQGPVGLRMVTPVGYHVHIKSSISGMEIARSYTAATPSLTNPNSDPEVAKGRTLYLMIKGYPGGAISPWICNLKQGDKVQLSNYDGNFDLNRLKKTTHLVMFAAGTGFTSMIRLITYSLFELKDATFPVKLVFFNKTMKDILWKDQLEELAKMYSRFSVVNILSQEKDPSWKGLKGRVCDDHIKKFVPNPADTPTVFFAVCGPWAYNDVVDSLAKLNGLEDEHIHVFSQTS